MTLSQLPFSAYDFFSYLSAGFVVIAGVDFAFRDGAALDDVPALPLALLAVVGAYVVGQIVAQLSGVLLERGPAALTAPPEETLFADESGSRLGRSSELYRPLEQVTRDRVIERARAAGFPMPTHSAPAVLGSKALWKHCFVRVRGDGPTAARMASFSALAAFSRNVALAALVAAVAIVGGIATGRAGAGAGWWLAAAVGAAAGLRLRYLRFRRLFHAEAYVAYAELPDTSTTL
jgi:hypothetical protein